MIDDKDPFRDRVIDLGRRNYRLRQQVDRLRYARLNWALLAVLGWGLLFGGAIARHYGW